MVAKLKAELSVNGGRCNSLNRVRRGEVVSRACHRRWRQATIDGGCFGNLEDQAANFNRDHSNERGYMGVRATPL